MKGLKQQDLDSEMSFMTAVFWIQFPTPLEWELVYEDKFFTRQGALSLLCTQGIVLVQSDWRRIIRLLCSLGFQKGNGLWYQPVSVLQEACWAAFNEEAPSLQTFQFMTPVLRSSGRSN